MPESSSGSCRSTAPRRGNLPAPGWAWRWPRNWSNCTAGRSTCGANWGTDRGSGSTCRWLKCRPISACRRARKAAPNRPARKAIRFADLEICDDRSTAGDAEDSQRPRATVLVVDDTPEMRALMGEILGEEYHVLFARDGAEGLEVAAAEHPDLIVSDVMMPKVDGQEFCRRIKADPQTAHVPFIMVTAKAGLDMKIEGLDCGADDYLAKPFDQKELRARTRSLLKLRGLHGDLDKQNRALQAAYQELKSLQGQLIQSEKMSSLGQLVAGLRTKSTTPSTACTTASNRCWPRPASSRRTSRRLWPARPAPRASATRWPSCLPGSSRWPR